MELDWRRSVVEVRPANRDQVHAALREAYAVAELGQPEVRWVETPGALLRASLPDRANVVFERAVHDLDPKSRCDLDQYMRAAWLRGTPTGQVVNRAFGEARDWNTLQPVWTELRRWMNGATSSESMIPRVAKAEFIAGSSWLDLGAWRPLVTLARECPGYLFGTDVAYACERHIAICIDGEDRLHSESGPAIEWPDGFVAHAWHGRWVSHDLFARRRSITLDEILAEPRSEQRDFLLEFIGYDRLVEIGPSVVLNEDDRGTLWQVPLPGLEAITLVEVVNSTPEPDGEWRRFFLRVPPRMRTAREAVAWTFGLSETDWEVAAES